MNGVGGAAINVTARTNIKITLGRNVVYILDVWVWSIGEGVECHLGMDFMTATRVRLSALETNVYLLVKERIPLAAPGSWLRQPTAIQVTIVDALYIQPGDYACVPILYGSRLKCDLQV